MPVNKKEVLNFELHKTDYNNYSDLSHFIEQYNIAQEIIKECGKFYKSFLCSKLMTWEQLLNCSWRNQIDFTYSHEYTSKYDYTTNITKTTTYNRIIDIYCKYLTQEETLFWSYNDEDEGTNLLKIVNIKEANKKLLKLKREKNTLAVNIAQTIQDNIPYDLLLELSFSYDNKIPKINKENYYKWVDAVRDIVKHYINKKPCFRLANKEVSKKVINFCKEEYKIITDQLDKIKKEIELLENCIKYTQCKNREKLGEELIEKFKSINLPPEFFHVPKDVYSLSYVSFTPYIYEFEDVAEDGTWHTMIKKIKNVRTIGTDEFNQAMNEIEDYIIGKVREHNIENIFTSKPDYFIIVNGELKPFSKMLEKVNIQLSDDQKQLICTDISISSRKAYCWPSDAPTIQTTTTTTLIFDTLTNEVLSYDVKKDTDEIKNKYARY